MNIARLLTNELDFEARATRAMLSRVPLDQLDWTPHEKSSSLGKLAWHVAAIPRVMAERITSGKFDLSSARPGTGASTDYIAEHDAGLEAVKTVIQAIPEDGWFAKFPVIRDGQMVAEMPLMSFIRTVLMNHIVHHRGQLAVYLRLLNVPVPATYGTSADEGI